MTKAQFDAAIKRYGFEPTGFLGYYRLPAPFSHVSVSVLNAGHNRRAQLAYLLRELELNLNPKPASRLWAKQLQP
jgi:hypothetical protein